jgi:hypothetical protein
MLFKHRLKGGYIETNKNLGFTDAHHFVVGYDWLINESLDLRAETYYQYLFHAPVENFPSSYSVLNTGDSFSPISPTAW